MTQWEQDRPRRHHQSPGYQHSHPAKAISTQADKQLHRGIGVKHDCRQRCDRTGRQRHIGLDLVEYGPRHRDTMEIGKKVDPAHGRQRQNLQAFPRQRTGEGSGHRRLIKGLRHGRRIIVSPPHQCKPAFLDVFRCTGTDGWQWARTSSFPFYPCRRYN